jgi:sigma-B regulation protein RsbU (phosphoserine phosphatase)
VGSILVIDDDRDSREAVARFLKRAGYAVHTAPNGRDALAAVATSIPDVIILDAMMPEMNGVDFLKVIRSYLRWATLPVILLTAYPEGPHIDEARELGVKQVFRKADYRLEDLLACVYQLIQGHGSERSGGIGA